ncbi:MAG: EAL domain-containing protein [Lachnospiraceae bacterium]|nr:EAL domain-containing protein [Lachnospiraceae bacterium]
MTDPAVFLNNYMLGPDLLTILVSLVIVILMRVSYIKKEENFIIFRRLPRLLILASAADILYHVLLYRWGVSLDPITYVVYLIYYGSLVTALYTYMIYSQATMWREDDTWIGMTGICRAFLVISHIVVIIMPFAGGMRFSQLESYAFAILYSLSMLILLYMILKCRHHVYGRIFSAIWRATLLATLLMYTQLIFCQTSFITATFLFPTITFLYLLHSNPYDFSLGAVGADAFEDMIAYNLTAGRDLYLMSLYIHDLELAGGDMPREVQKKIRYYGDRFIKGSQLFRISDGHFILVLDTHKNPSYEASAHQMLESFYGEYKKFGLNYKIVFMSSIHEISAKNDYIPMLQFLHSKMDENEVLKVSEEDIEAYRRHDYILDELRDIGAKKDMKDDRVLVFCQPVLNTRTGKYDTAEALMRLKLPETGMVFPDQFIPLAEKYGLIHTLSLIILAKTCSEIRSLLDEGYNVKRLSVNFSMIDVREPDFAQNVKDIVTAAGIPNEKIAIEITESQNERDFLLVKERLHELRDSGIKFYLDDFGTGYSSFERIMELPFDIIKFDRSLTIASRADKKIETMVTYLAHMFTDMNYSVLYEGVEDDKDENLCIRMYARYLQGYKYSKPVPIEHLRDFFVKE